MAPAGKRPGPTRSRPFSSTIPALTPGPHGLSDAVDPNRRPQGSLRRRSRSHRPVSQAIPERSARIDQGIVEYLRHFILLENAAIKVGYDIEHRITAFRKLYYDSPGTTKTYAGAMVGGGAWNILIPGATAAIPASWTAPPLAASVVYLQKHQVLAIGGQKVDIGHALTGLDAARHPTRIDLAGGVVRLRSNKEATTYVGDLGSVVVEYIHGSKASFYDVARKRSVVLEDYFDGVHGFASVEDMAGNADAYVMTVDPGQTLAHSLANYYEVVSGAYHKRWTRFAAAIALGRVIQGKFTGDTLTWRNALREEVFNAALAYAAAKGWREDIFLVMKDPGPGWNLPLIGGVPTFWEAYWNISGWVVDIMITRLVKEVAAEAAAPPPALASARRAAAVTPAGILSGPAWVSRFPTSQSTADLAPTFRSSVERFLSALNAGGATVSIAATYRPPERAYLMHYAWMIAREGLDPAQVPAKTGVNILWVHRDAKGQTDLQASRNAAAQMVAGYGIAYQPSLTSRHTERRAIDMSISWQGDLTIKRANGHDAIIKSSPRSGGNSTLHQVGASYGVIKLVSDPPHWSDDGH